MTRFLRYYLLLVALCFSVICSAQTQSYREMHKVKKGETVFGIAKKYDLTIDQLVKANPDMNAVGYELKKGDYIFIPYPENGGSKAETSTAKQSATTTKQPATTTAKQANTLRVGVMLPLHNVDGDGRRMVEYYRGLLLGCEDLKKAGHNIDIKAWNVNIDADINTTLADADAAKCDIIFGPLYTKQVAPLAAFTKKNGIKMVIPFSISGNDVESNPDLFQVYQSPQVFYAEVIKQFVYRFAGHHVVVIDCNDRTSDKGIFTFNLRKALQEKGATCSVTNLTNSDESFANAFSKDKPNVVVLNTGRSPELNAAIAKLDHLKATSSAVGIKIFGYTEWLMYAKYNMEKFCKYDTYIPTTFYYNTVSTATRTLEQRYRTAFSQEMLDYMPRFAITGYDHAQYFLGGMIKQGKSFTGAETQNTALQTPLHFKRTGTGKNAGLQNVSLMFVHYNPNKSISTINF